MLHSLRIAAAAAFLLSLAGTAAAAPQFSISEGMPAVFPIPTAPLDTVAVTFRPAFNGDDRHEEKPPAKLQSVRFRIVAPDAKIASIRGLEEFTEGPPNTFFRESGTAPCAVTIRLVYNQVGEYSVTLEGEATLDDGSKLPASLTQKVPVMDVKIEVNGTEPADDDVVQTESAHPKQTFRAPALMRLVGPKVAFDVKVFLVNHSGHLGIEPKSTLLFKEGERKVDFQVAGKKGSAKKDDADLTPTFDSEEGPAATKKYMSVFWFSNAVLTGSTKGAGTYSLQNERFACRDANGKATFAIFFIAQADLEPEKLDVTVSPLKDIKIGVVQDAVSVAVTGVYNAPVLAWLPATPAGTKVKISTELSVTRKLATEHSDASVTAEGKQTETWPLYQAQRPDGKGVASPRYGTAAEKRAQLPAVVSDDPFATFVKVIPSGVPVNGKIVATVQRTLATAKIDDELVTWCVAYNIATKQFVCLKEQRWSLHVSSDDAVPRSATLIGGPGEPTSDPVVELPTANQASRDVRNRSTSSGAATQEFVK